MQKIAMNSFGEKTPHESRRYTVTKLLDLHKDMMDIPINIGKLTEEGASKLFHGPRPVFASSPFQASGIVNAPPGTMTPPFQFILETRDLIAAAGHPVRSETPRQPDDDDSDEELLYEPRIKQQETWVYDRPTYVERSSQPLSAPSGLAAQKAENFRKFFRAVVSPTHVRVTAGGRIVPNTRPPKTPQFVWNYNTHYFEQVGGQPVSRRASVALHLDAGTDVAGLEQFPPPIQSQSASCSFEKPAAQASIQAPLKSANQEAIASSATEPGDAANTTDTANAAQQDIQISPPAQFDLSKPFMYRGQLVYPVPPGFMPSIVPTPVSVLGNTSILHHANGHLPSGNAWLAPLVSGPVTGFPVLNAHVGQRAPYTNTNNGQPVVMTGFSQWYPAMTVMPMPQPQISNTSKSPPISVIATQQIQTLENQIKWLDNQLENNRHQIDVIALSQQREVLRCQITALQAALAAHLAHQDQYSAAVALQGDTGGPGIQNTDLALADTTNDGMMQNRLDNPPGTTGTFFDKGPSTVKKLSIRQPDGTAISVTAESEDPGCTVKPKTKGGSRLPAAAAMAPPFQPRSQILNQTFQTKDRGLIGENAHPKIHSAKVTNSGHSTLEVDQFMAQNRAPTMSTWDNTSTHPPQVQRAQTAHAPQTKNDLAGFSMPDITSSFGPILDGPDDCPYLMGFPPPGMNFGKALSTDLIYSRPLTEEEKQARHLYWGKAPREVCKGLPRFDGRDFYPPSPIKVNGVPVTGHSSSSNGAAYSSTFDDDWQTTQAAQERQRLTNTTSSGSSDGYRAINPDSADAQNEIKPVQQTTPNVEDDRASLDSWGQEKPKVASRTPSFHQSNSASSRPPSFKAPVQQSRNAPSALSHRTNQMDNSQTTKFVGYGDRTYRPPNTMHPGYGEKFYKDTATANYFQGSLKGMPQHTRAPPVTGMSSSATAQGYLRRYGGSATAALAPNGFRPPQGSDENNSYSFADRTSRPMSMQSSYTENRSSSRISAPIQPMNDAADLLRRINHFPHDRRIVATEPWNTGNVPASRSGVWQM